MKAAPAAVAYIIEEDGDLAVLELAGGATVLLLDADRLVAPLDEARLINDQDGLGVLELLDYIGAEVIPHGIGIPARRIEEPLHAIRCRIAHGFR